jgi:hypothetical protein
MLGSWEAGKLSPAICFSLIAALQHHSLLSSQPPSLLLIMSKPTKSREQELLSQGWVKQSTHDEPRLSDVVEMYTEIGLEVHLEPFDPATEDACTQCLQASAKKFKTIYTHG